MYPLLCTELESSRARSDALTTDGPALREWLLRNVRGLGWKEASHFLRNIGYQESGDSRPTHPEKSEASRSDQIHPENVDAKRYIAIERAFLKFSGAIGIPMDELDLLFWSRETGEILK